MADVSVRPARPVDAAEVARIQIETWRAGYTAILPPSALESLSTHAAQDVWHASIATPPTARHRVLIAREQQWCVGFVAFGPADDVQPDDPEPALTIALGPLLVEPRWGRRGHGSRLLAAATDQAREDGMARAIVWIPEGDTSSRAFFLSAGWAPDGLTRAWETGDGELRELRLHCSLAQVPT